MLHASGGVESRHAGGDGRCDGSARSLATLEAKLV